jgi:hypothetical protein
MVQNVKEHSDMELIAETSNIFCLAPADGQPSSAAEPAHFARI